MKNVRTTLLLLLWITSPHLFCSSASSLSNNSNPETSETRPIARTSLNTSTEAGPSATNDSLTTAQQPPKMDPGTDPRAKEQDPLDTGTIIAVSVTLVTLLLAAFTTAFIVKYCCVHEDGRRRSARQAHSAGRMNESQTSPYMSIVHHHQDESCSPPNVENLIYAQIEHNASHNQILAESCGPSEVIYAEIAQPAFLKS